MYTRSAVFRVNAGSEPDSPTPVVFRRNTATSPWKLDACRTLAAGAPRSQVYARDVGRATTRSSGMSSSRNSFSLLRCARARSSTRQILPLIVFRQLGELEASDALVRCELLA